MGDEPKDERTYDTIRLRTLQQDLGRLNEAFLPRAARGGRATAKHVRPNEASAVAASDGKAKRSAKAKTKAAANAEAVPAGSTSAKAKSAKAKSAKTEPGKTKPGKSKSAKAAKGASAAKSKRATARADHGSAQPSVAPADKGKAGARRLLAMLRRGDGDDSPLVPGTDFTEGGVVRLLAHLRRRKSQSFRFLRRLLRVLSRPAALGMRTSAGVSVERLQLVGRQLEEIEIHGWDHFQSRRIARRGRQGLPFAPAVTGSSDAPATEV